MHSSRPIALEVGPSMTSASSVLLTKTLTTNGPIGPFRSLSPHTPLRRWSVPALSSLPVRPEHLAERRYFDLASGRMILPSREHRTGVARPSRAAPPASHEWSVHSA